MDLMVADEIKAGLGTEILGREIICYAQTGSTNDVALELAGNGSQEGTLIVAEGQTRGRGRRERKWHSPIGTSILASLILRPSITLHDAHAVTLMSAAATAQAIRSETQLPALIKWPNDVIVNDRKVSGVLTEVRAEGQSVNFIVVGIGVTVNLPGNRFPEELKTVATSLSAELGHEVSRIALLQKLLRELEKRYVELCHGGLDSLVTDWKKLLATIGYRVRISLPRRIVEGYAVDVDQTGALLIRMDTGQIRRVTADEAAQLRHVIPVPEPDVSLAKHEKTVG